MGSHIPSPDPTLGGRSTDGDVLGLLLGLFLNERGQGDAASNAQPGDFLEQGSEAL